MGQTVKTSTQTAIVILPFHRDVLTIAQAGARAQESMGKKMRALLVSRFGAPTIGTDSPEWGKPGAAGGPDFETYRTDTRALRQLAADKGLASDQYLRKTFNAAVRDTYGALPVSMAPDAVALRAKKEAEAAVIAAAKVAGTLPSEPAKPGPTSRKVGPEETSEQAVARMGGPFVAMYAALRILGTDERVKPQLVHIRKMLDKLHDIATAPATKPETATSA